MDVAQGKPCTCDSLSSAPPSLFASTEAGSSCFDDASESQSLLRPSSPLCCDAVDVQEEPLKDSLAGALLASLLRRRGTSPSSGEPRWRLCVEAVSRALNPPSAEFCIQGGKDRVHRVRAPLTECVGDLARRALIREGAGPVEAACCKARLRTAEGRLLPSEARIGDVAGCGGLRLVARKSSLAATRCGCSVRRICSQCQALGIDREPARVCFDEDSDMPKQATPL